MNQKAFLNKLNSSLCPPLLNEAQQVFNLLGTHVLNPALFLPIWCNLSNYKANMLFKLMVIKMHTQYTMPYMFT